MVRKRRDITEHDVQNWIRQGFGQGEGDEYKPWSRVRDVPSLGRSTRIGALRHKRVHDLYSDVETGHFLQVDFSLGVSEIREQVLLDREETIEIAARLGIRHPTYPGTRVPVGMTSDLFVLRDGHPGGPFLLCVKRDEAVQANAKGLRRTLEKLQIEKRYWDNRGVPWRLVTQRHFDAMQVRNLALLRPAPRVWRSQEGLKLAQAVSDLVISRRGRRFSLRKILDATGWGPQAAFEALGHAIWRRLLKVDLTHPLNPDRPLQIKEDLEDAA